MSKPSPWLVVSVRDDADDGVLQGAMTEMETRGYRIHKVMHLAAERVYVIVGARQ